MDDKENKPAEGKSDELEKKSRAKRSTGGNYWDTHPHIVITGGAEELNKPGRGNGGSLLAQPKPPANFNDKLHLESEQIAKSTAKALEEAVKKTEADKAAKIKAEAQAQAKAKAEQEALTTKMKKESENRLQKNREADAKREADRKQAEADRKKAEAGHQAAEKAKAEIKAKAAAESKAKADAIIKARKERFSKAGVKPAPSYTAQMVAKANTALKAPDALVLNQTPGSAQLTLAGQGVWTATDEIAGNLSHWFNQALSKLSVPEVSAGALRLSVATLLLHSEPVGKGSDKVPGRDLEAMFALNAQHLAGTGVKIEPGSKSIELPVRGSLVHSDGQLTLGLLKTGPGVAKAVQVLTAVRDAATGLDKITVPAMAGIPEQHILINPAPSHPATPPHTGTPIRVPVTPVHTGTAVKPVQPLMVTTTPVETLSGIYDFIYWRPDASGTDVEPVYVMLSQNPRKLPGIVTGKGEGTGEKWLNDANKNVGVAIPVRIANKLQGRKFSTFDTFRKAFWTEVGKDQELLKQFKANNKGNLMKGNSPLSIPSEQVGERTRFELHHVKYIKDNGAVYDVDNIRAITPKQHIKIHKGDK